MIEELGHGPPVAAVERVAPAVPHHEVVSRGMVVSGMLADVSAQAPSAAEARAQANDSPLMSTVFPSRRWSRPGRPMTRFTRSASWFCVSAGTRWKTTMSPR